MRRKLLSLNMSYKQQQHLEPPVKNVSLSKGRSKSMSHREMINWVNAILRCNLVKLDHLRTGAAYCQLLHMLYPSALNLGRVKFCTNLEYDCFQNLKLLQAAFNKKGIDMQVPYDNLVKGQILETTYFMQWLIKFFNANYYERGYQPIVARNGIILAYDSPAKQKKLAAAASPVAQKKNASVKPETIKQAAMIHRKNTFVILPPKVSKHAPADLKRGATFVLQKKQTVREACDDNNNFVGIEHAKPFLKQHQLVNQTAVSPNSMCLKNGKTFIVEDVEKVDGAALQNEFSALERGNTFIKPEKEMETCIRWSNNRVGLRGGNKLYLDQYLSGNNSIIFKQNVAFSAKPQQSIQYDSTQTSPVELKKGKTFIVECLKVLDDPSLCDTSRKLTRGLTFIVDARKNCLLTHKTGPRTFERHALEAKFRSRKSFLNQKIVHLHDFAAEYDRAVGENISTCDCKKLHTKSRTFIIDSPEEVSIDIAAKNTRGVHFNEKRCNKNHVGLKGSSLRAVTKQGKATMEHNFSHGAVRKLMRARTFIIHPRKAEKNIFVENCTACSIGSQSQTKKKEASVVNLENQSDVSNKISAVEFGKDVSRFMENNKIVRKPCKVEECPPTKYSLEETSCEQPLETQIQNLAERIPSFMYGYNALAA